MKADFKNIDENILTFPPETQKIQEEIKVKEIPNTGTILTRT